MSTAQVYDRLSASVESAERTLAETETLMTLFTRKMRERLNAQIKAELWSDCCEGCEASYSAAACRAYVLEGDAVFVEPKPCPHCSGWRTVPSTKEAARVA